MGLSTYHPIPAAAEGEGRAVSPNLRRFAWALLVYNIAVILWGAVVRATGSGAGCGDHWPLCNGTVLPLNPRVATVIEFVHRMMSGACLLFVILLVAWVFRRTPRRHLARAAAVGALLLTLNEAFLGALLVKLGLTAESHSPWRPPMLALHLANTLLLLGALTMTAEFLGRRFVSGLQAGPMRGRLQIVHGPLATAGVLASIVVGISGSLAALGDTLFPAASLHAALQQDFSSSEWLLRLRVVHPASAIAAAAFIVWLLRATVFRKPAQTGGRLGWALVALLALQFALGTLDVLLRAPVWLQVTHLAAADALWATLVALTLRVCLVPAPAPR